VSPIFVRPVREQLEHDRLIRFLQSKYKRKFEVAMNVGEEQTAPVKLGTHTFYPDLVLTDGRRLAGLVEVETGESVNNLEAMAQWVHFARSRIPFHLYVPIGGVDAARRLCEQNAVSVAEIWTYRASMDGFDLIRAFHDPSAAGGGGARDNSRKQPVAARAPVAAKPAAGAKPPTAAKPASVAKAAVAGPRTAPDRAASRKPTKPAPKPARPSRGAKARPSKATRPADRSTRKPARPKKAAASKR
jgi:hypothetical protein